MGLERWRALSSLREKIQKNILLLSNANPFPGVGLATYARHPTILVLGPQLRWAMACKGLPPRLRSFSEGDLTLKLNRIPLELTHSDFG